MYDAEIYIEHKITTGIRSYISNILLNKVLDMKGGNYSEMLLYWVFKVRMSISASHFRNLDFDSWSLATSHTNWTVISDTYVSYPEKGWTDVF